MSEEAWFEHQFWLQILGDHARFILNALSSREKQDIERAEAFKKAFDDLLEQARLNGKGLSLSALNKQADEAVQALRSFKLNLLDRRLLNQVQIALTPTFLNHMVNELEEYLKILQALIAGKDVPIYHPLHHDLIWLPDAAGHAAAIASDLDGVEKRLMKKSKEFEKHFEQFYLKAVELTGYLRTMRQSYPSISKFHKDIDMEMNVFQGFLQEIEHLDLSAELLSRINPLMPDHMFREECYYLMKLAQSGQVPPPSCNPAKPRIEA
ncbi:deoxyadenosine/deoxycytidine kinase [Paenibacillus phyllosphaerae]|uniref:Deoxyadenosine/deoxycytidine kinase n=1 Tax=Paenibacillus phyllosphaerae TaxID=274593 RepID=A0A7W5AZ48_9BACL|nr:DUF2935 domain-containing protein [Paenibacillus phyllosphaerae]MBB3111453.1 deoxyadenosine/deoxycytidine kinase [Paenibacillus phyllosphaerae]